MWMKRIRTRASLLLAICLSSACSTGHGIAKKHLDNARYELALSAYAQILQENPKDSRASEGLRLAREGTISKRLLSVRMARLGGTMRQSLELLRQIVADENSWSIFPRGPVFTTQREETEEHILHFSDMVDGYIFDRQPLAAKLYFEKYKAIFWRGNTLSRARNLGERISELGRKSCAELASEVTREQVYFRSFVDRYCRYWDVEKALPEQPTRSIAGDGFYSTVALEGLISNLPQGVSMGLIREQLQRALESSPYYDPRSPNPMTIRLQGQFKASVQENVVNLEHSYFEEEPYVELTEVKKKRSIPYDELVRVSSSTEKFIKVQRLRTEEYTEPRELTKYRRVPRIHSFIGFRYRQDLSLQIDGNVIVEGRQLDLALSEVDHREGVAHDLELPAIGLRKQNRILIEQAPWLTDRANLLRTTFSDKLDGLWINLFCRNERGSGAFTNSESAHKCRQSTRGADSELVIRWFKSRLGVLPSDAKLAFSQ
jgi:hypothetical protein